MQNGSIFPSLNQYPKNNLFIKLRDEFHFPEDILQYHFDKYLIGTARTGDPIYWQLDQDWSLKNGTLNGTPILNINAYPPGTFGAHLLREAGQRTMIMVTEMPEDALILDMYFKQTDKIPHLIWIACGRLPDLFSTNKLPLKMTFFECRPNLCYFKAIQEIATRHNKTIQYVKSQSGEDTIQRIVQERPPSTLQETFDPSLLKTNYNYRRNLISGLKKTIGQELVKILISELELELDNISLYSEEC